MKSEATRVIIDRIEGDLAVLVLSDDDRVTFNLPLRCLPEGAKEGDHLRMRFDEDEPARESAKEKIAALLNELKNK